MNEVPPQASLQSIRVLGSNIQLIDLIDAVSIISEWIEIPQNSRRCKHIVVTGFHGIWEAQKNSDLKYILNSSDLWIPDGIAPIWVARLHGYRNARRTTGAELMRAFFEIANERGYSSFFYGDTYRTLDALRANVYRRYPGHKVAGMLSPPFRSLTAEEGEEHVRAINETAPDVLWVGLGMPKQDEWIFHYKDRLDVSVAIGVGAAFKFMSGEVQRVPKWIGDRGFEWLWRLVHEPKRLWRRDLFDGPRFVVHVLLEMIGLREYP